MARGLYEVIVQERFNDDWAQTFEIPEGLISKFRLKIALYREVLLLQVLISESKRRKGFEKVLLQFEKIIFTPTLTAVEAQKINTINSVREHLRRLLANPQAKDKVNNEWGLEWFRDIGHEECNPARVALFLLHWMDEYIGAAKAVSKLDAP